MTLVLHVIAIVLLSVKYGYLTSNVCYFAERLMYSKYASYYLVFFSSWNQFWTLYFTVKHEGLGIRLAVLRFLVQQFPLKIQGQNCVGGTFTEDGKEYINLGISRLLTLVFICISLVVAAIGIFLPSTPPKEKQLYFNWKYNLLYST